MRIVALGLFCVVGSAILGVETAGDVRTFEGTFAQETTEETAPVSSGMPGDFNCNRVTPEAEDARIALEIALGYEHASECQQEASRTGRPPSFDDALRVLRQLTIEQTAR